jgi:ABC-type dipeptide/oligopeptide/nickel transport system permease component
MYLIPGDASSYLVNLEEEGARPEDILQIRSIYDLDQPWYIQYFCWITIFWSRHILLEGHNY